MPNYNKHIATFATIMLFMWVFLIFGCESPTEPNKLYKQGKLTVHRSCTDCHENTKTCRPEFIGVSYE